jgi:predicted amidohydrolase
MKITVVQQDIIWNDVEANLQRMERLFKAAPKSDIYLFPEMCSTGFTLKPGKMAERVNGATAQRMLQWAAKYDAAFAGSVMTVDDEGRFYNRMYFARPDGRLDHYDKCNLFIYSGEDKVYTAGKEAVVWEFRGARIRPAICYDIRFPVFLYNRNEYDILLVSAAFPTSRMVAWDTLIKARAIENLCYVAASNRVGVDDFGDYCGHSVIINPYGAKVGKCRSGCQGTTTVELDWDLLTNLRNRSLF